MNFTCPVCLYRGLDFRPADYEICPCCGTEFGNDDERTSHQQLRQQWVRRGAPWFFREPPRAWNPYLQLIEGGAAEAVPAFTLTPEINVVSPLSLDIGMPGRLILSLVA